MIKRIFAAIFLGAIIGAGAINNEVEIGKKPIVEYAALESGDFEPIDT